MLFTNVRSYIVTTQRKTSPKPNMDMLKCQHFYTTNHMSERGSDVGDSSHTGPTLQDPENTRKLRCAATPALADEDEVREGLSTVVSLH